MFRCPLRSLTLSNDLPWPPKWRSFQNTPSYTCGVSFHRFFGVENPNLRSDWCLDVNWGHWRCPMTSLDLQNGDHFRIRPLTHVGCLFLGFWGGESECQRNASARRLQLEGEIRLVSIERFTMEDQRSNCSIDFDKLNVICAIVLLRKFL